ncbi:hypothetical protein HMPREF3198_01600 [Winkia neuii]|nr:hypothetical protein HMPREF3198_01600 [Winkia neuii]
MASVRAPPRAQEERFEASRRTSEPRTKKLVASAAAGFEMVGALTFTREILPVTDDDNHHSTPAHRSTITRAITARVFSTRWELFVGVE